ncbi:MFS transporter [Salana multivorans]
MAHAPADIAAIQRRTLVVLIVTQVIGAVGVGVAPSIGILLAGEVTDSEAWAGLARTASTLGAALFGLPLGALAARRGRRLALSIGWWVGALGAAVLVLAAQLDAVVPLFVGLLLIGAGSAVALQSRFAATDLAEPRHKARALGLVVWVGTLGSVLGPNLGAPGELVGAATGLTVFASAFLIAAICLALAGTLVFLLLRPDPMLVSDELMAAAREMADDAAVRPAASASDAEPAADLAPGAPGVVDRPLPPRRKGAIRRLVAEVRTNPGARAAVVAILVGQVIMVAIMTMTPVHIVHHGGSINLVGITISLHVVGMFALAPVVGMMTDRYGHGPTMAIGVVVLLASLVIGAVRPDDMGWIVVSLVLLGLGWSFVNVTGSALFSVAVSSETRAASQGGVDALANLFGASAAFAAGPLLAATSFATLSLLTIAVLAPLVVIVVRLVRVPVVVR